MTSSTAEDALGALSELIERITTRQGDIALHRENIRLATQAGLDDESAAARELATMFVAAGDSVWLPLLAHKSKELEDTPDAFKELLSLYQRAGQDHLSVPVLLSQMEFVIGHQESMGLLDEDTEEIDATRAALGAIVQKGVAHVTEGYKLWDRWRDWEVELLEEAPTSDRQALVDRVDAMYLERLQVPHSTHEATATAYSTFVSTYRPNANYEDIMVAVTQARAHAKAAWEARETSEIGLRNASNSLAAYAAYLVDEKKRQPRAEPQQRRGRKPPVRNPALDALGRSLYLALHERAISAAAERIWAGEGDASEAETYLRSFWAAYAVALRVDKDTPAQKELAVLYRASRSIPGSGEAWARYIRAIERHAEYEGPKEGVEEAFARALETEVVKDSVDELVPLVLARADFERRSLADSAMQTDGDDEQGDDAALVMTLDGGIELVRQVNSTGGDSRLRLEKYLGGWYERKNLHDKAIELWEKAAKFHKTSYIAWSEYLRVLTFTDPSRARTVFQEVAGKNIDWPEMLWEQWRTFEHAHGSVDDFEEAITRIATLNDKLTARRAQEAAQYQYPTATAAPSGTNNTVVAEDSMQVDSTDESHAQASSRKRKTDEEDVPSAGEATKRVKIDQSTLKRDRENAEVVVSGLEPTATEEEIRALFKNCGEIREIKLVTLGDGTVAIVEFMTRDSVPAALTRDKKRVLGQEVSVHASWRSTLYVTNFPEESDDAEIRKMFGVFGHLLDVRWPSKKFKSTRRFCYIQYTSPDHAEAALSLHGKQLAPGMKLTVLVSDPQRKKERTDADANEREVYIAGLSRFAKKEDLELLFQQFGPIKEVRMALDEKGHSKGFAFIEFNETRSAHSALTANNHELKNRRIAVTMSDSRVRGKQKLETTGLSQKNSLRERSVRVKGLPADTQEGLLQQALEKVIEGIKRVEVLQESGDALIELESAAAVGKLMLRGAPVVFMDRELTILEEGVGHGRLGPSRTRSGAASGAGSSTGGASTRAAPGGSSAAPPAILAPRATTRPRPGIGSKPRAAIAPVGAGQAAGSNPAPAPTAGSTSGKDQDDFRRMLGT